MSYLPIPPRVWSRVQNQCSVNTSSSNIVFEPLTGQYLPQEEYNKLKQIQIKGNILQYKNNSTQLTKKQKYSQIAKGKWINRTKTWATQSLTYSNPNTTCLQRVNTSTLAATANTPFVTNTYSIPSNPFNCSINVSRGIIDGGNLVGTITVNPCTNEILKTTTINNCSLSTDCDVPGPPIALCWNPKLPTYYPRQNLTNNNSTDKWPTNYKELVSSLRPIPPILLLDNVNDNTVYLSWTYDDKICIPITSFNVYQIVNGIASLVNKIPFPVTSTILYNLLNCTEYIFYITALSTNIESDKSNEVSTFIRVLYGPTISTISAGCDSATFTWQLPNIPCINITGYYIYKNNIKINGLLPLPIGPPYTSTVTPLSPCADYNFNVSYYDSISGTESYLSNTATVTEIPCPPTITNITFDYTTNSQNIFFTAPVASCTVNYYNLYQTITPINTYSPINLSPYNLTAINLQSTPSQGEHSFYMTSYSTNNNTESSNSNSFSIPPPPINLTGDTIVPGEIILNWTNQTPTTGLSITKNKIYIQDTATSIFLTPILVDPSNNTYTITSINGITIGSSYNIFVTALISSNSTESIFSNLFFINLPANIITISNLLNYDNTYSYIDTNNNYGFLIFSDINSNGSVDISFNYPGYSIEIIAIGAGGNGGNGGFLLPNIYVGGGGGGGGGYTSSTINNGNYTYTVTIGTPSAFGNPAVDTNINYNGINITAGSAGNGANGANYTGGSGGAGGIGVNGVGGNGGKGSDFNNNNSTPGSDGTVNDIFRTIPTTPNPRTYEILFGGGGGGGSIGGNAGKSPGNCNGSQGGIWSAGPNNYSDGQPSSYTILPFGNYLIFCGGGGGGAAGGSNNGGGGSQGVVVFYWNFT